MTRLLKLKSGIDSQSGLTCRRYARRESIVVNRDHEAQKKEKKDFLV